MFFVSQYSSLIGQQKLVDSLNTLILSSKSDSQKILLTCEIAVEYRNNNLDTTLFLAQKALNQSISIKFPKGQGRALRVIGIYYLMKGNNSEALSYYQQANKFAAQTKDTFELGWSYINIGTVYKNIGNNEKALENYFAGLKIFETMNNQRAIGWIYGNIGLIYSVQLDFNSAVEYYKKSLYVREKVGNKSDIIVSLINIGASYISQKDYQKAMKYLFQSLQISKKIQDHVGEISSYNKLGICYIQLAENKNAKQYLDSGLYVAKKFDNKKEIIEVYTTLSKFYNTVYDYSEAFIFGKLALDLAKESANIVYIKDASEQYSIAGENLGNYKEAYQSLKLFKKTSDSLNNEVMYKKTLQLDYKHQEENQRIEQEKITLASRFELDRQKGIRNTFIVVSLLLLVLFFYIYKSFRDKQKANNLLQRQNIEIQQQKEEITSQAEQLELVNHTLETNRDELQVLNKTKDKFFSIIAHDLKNPIGALMGNTEILMNAGSSINDEQRNEFYQIINFSAKHTYSLLDNLLNWARTQTGSIKHNPKNTSLTGLIKENITLLDANAKNKNINLFTDVTDDIRILSDPNMIKTVIRNLITNAIKFTHDQGSIKISVETEDDIAKIHITDSGVGISEENIAKIFKVGEHHSTQGTNNEAGTGLGLVICREFVEKNGGRIWVTSKECVGTTFSFTVPLATQAQTDEDDLFEM